MFYPADLQYLPEDIPRLVAPILAGRADIVTGTKQGKYEKAFVSRVYNTLCRWLFGVRVTDLGDDDEAVRLERLANAAPVTRVVIGDENRRALRLDIPPVGCT